MINNRVFLKENVLKMGLFAGIICDFRQIDGDERTAAAAVKGDELNVVCLMELILQICHDLGGGVFVA